MERYLKKFKHNDVIVSVKYSPTGQYLASASIDGEIYIHHRNRYFQRDKQFLSPFHPITGIWFSEDEKWLLVGHQYGHLSIYKLPNAKLYKTIQLKQKTNEPNILPGTSKPILDWVISANYSAKQNIFVFLESRELFEINLNSTQIKRHQLFSGSFFDTSVASLDGSQIFFGDESGFIYRFQHDNLQLSIFSRCQEILPTRSEVGGSISMRETNTSIVSLAISSEKNLLASTSRDGGIQLWNIEQQIFQDFEYQNIKPLAIREPIQRGWMRGIDFLPNSPNLVVGSDDGTLEVCNFSNGQITNAGNFGESIRSISASPDGSEIAIGCKNGQVFVTPRNALPELASTGTGSMPLEDWYIINNFSVSPPQGNLFWFCLNEFESSRDLEIRRLIYLLFIPSSPLVSPIIGKGQKQFSDELNFYEGIIRPKLIENIPCEDDEHYVKSLAMQYCSSHKILGIAIRGDKKWLSIRHNAITDFFAKNYKINGEGQESQSLKYLGRTTFIERNEQNPNYYKIDGSLHAFDGYARGVGLHRTLTLKSYLVERHNFKDIIHDDWFLNHKYKIRR